MTQRSDCIIFIMRTFRKVIRVLLDERENSLVKYFRGIITEMKNSYVHYIYNTNIA